MNLLKISKQLDHQGIVVENNHLGCFNNLKRHPILSGWRITVSRLTPKYCIRSCFARRFPYAALVSSWVIYCIIFYSCHVVNKIVLLRVTIYSLNNFQILVLSIVDCIKPNYVNTTIVTILWQINFMVIKIIKHFNFIINYLNNLRKSPRIESTRLLSHMY